VVRIDRGTASSDVMWQAAPRSCNRRKTLV